MKTVNAFSILHSHVNGSRYSNEKCLDNDYGGNREVIQEERSRDLMEVQWKLIVIIYWK
jgi:hypothetical protein